MGVNFFWGGGVEGRKKVGPLWTCSSGWFVSERNCVGHVLAKAEIPSCLNCCWQRKWHHSSSGPYLLCGAQCFWQDSTAWAQTQWPKCPCDRGEQERVCQVRHWRCCSSLCFQRFVAGLSCSLNLALWFSLWHLCCLWVIEPMALGHVSGVLVLPLNAYPSKWIFSGLWVNTVRTFEVWGFSTSDCLLFLCRHAHHMPLIISVHSEFSVWNGKMSWNLTCLWAGKKNTRFECVPICCFHFT